MDDQKFSDLFSLYLKHRLSSKGVVISGDPIPKFGFDFLWRKATGVSLMWHDKEIGRALLRDGTIVFDPPIVKTGAAHTFEDDLDQWASRAYARSIRAIA
jgi:hypothetical protein